MSYKLLASQNCGIKRDLQTIFGKLKMDNQIIAIIWITLDKFISGGMVCRSERNVQRVK